MQSDAMAGVVRGPWAERDAERQPRTLNDRDLLAVAAYELDSGLQVLMGRVETLQHLDAPPRVARVAEQITSDAERLSRLVRDYLLYGQLHRRPLLVHGKPALFLPLLVQLAERARETFGRFPELRCSPGACGMIDRERMEQALWSILRNAYEHGVPPVVVSVAEAGDWLECGVGDCGAGFDQASPPTDPEPAPRPEGAAPTGSGIGLWLATAIIEAHGGTLWVGRAHCGGAHIGFRVPASRRPTRRHGTG